MYNVNISRGSSLRNTLGLLGATIDDSTDRLKQQSKSAAYSNALEGKLAYSDAMDSNEVIKQKALADAVQEQQKKNAMSKSINDNLQKNKFSYQYGKKLDDSILTLQDNTAKTLIDNGELANNKASSVQTILSDLKNGKTTFTNLMQGSNTTGYDPTAVEAVTNSLHNKMYGNKGILNSKVNKQYSNNSLFGKAMNSDNLDYNRFLVSSMEDATSLGYSPEKLASLKKSLSVYKPAKAPTAYTDFEKEAMKAELEAAKGVHDSATKIYTKGISGSTTSKSNTKGLVKVNPADYTNMLSFMDTTGLTSKVFTDSRDLLNSSAVINGKPISVSAAMNNGLLDPKEVTSFFQSVVATNKDGTIAPFKDSDTIKKEFGAFTRNKILEHANKAKTTSTKTKQLYGNIKTADATYKNKVDSILAKYRNKATAPTALSNDSLYAAVNSTLGTNYSIPKKVIKPKDTTPKGRNKKVVQHKKVVGSKEVVGQTNTGSKAVTSEVENIPTSVDASISNLENLINKYSTDTTISNKARDALLANYGNAIKNLYARRDREIAQKRNEQSSNLKGTKVIEKQKAVEAALDKFNKDVSVDEIPLGESQLRAIQYLKAKYGKSKINDTKAVKSILDNEIRKLSVSNKKLAETLKVYRNGLKARER